MVDYVKINNGAWNSATSWDIGAGWPSLSTDTAVLGAFDTEIPAGIAIECGAITMVGTSSADRSRLIQNGDLAITADMTLGAWNELNVLGSAELELNGNDVRLISNTVGHNRVVFRGTALNRCRIKSSVPGIGRIRRLANYVRCHVDIQFCDFEDIGGLGGTSSLQGIGRNWTFAPGDFVRILDYTVTGCGAMYIGGTNHIDVTQVMARGDYRDTRVTTGYQLYFIDDQNVGAGAGDIELHSHTFSDNDSLSIRSVSRRLTNIDNCVFSNSAFQISGISGFRPNVTNSFVYMGVTGTREVAVAAGGICRDTYVLHERNNPKPFNANFPTLENVLLELALAETYNDDGDLKILDPLIDISATFCVVISDKSDVWTNALGAAMAANYEVNNNTLVGEFTNYGAFLRTESGGSITGAYNAVNNITYSRTLIAGSRGINFDAGSPAPDMINTMDYNCWFNIETPYFGVTSLTKTPGVTVGYGGNDLIDINPEFRDATRNAAQYDLLQGTGVGTVAAIVADMLNINGYDPVTKSQIPANASPRRPVDLHTWVRTGYAPTNPVFENAGAGGVTIGAVEYFALNVPPAIVGEPDFLRRGDTNFILGTEFGANQGSSTLSYNGQALTITSWTDIRVDFVVPSNMPSRYASTHTFVITTAGGSDESAAVPFLPPLGRQYANLINPEWGAPPEPFLLHGFSGTPDPLTTDQVECDLVTTPDNIPIVINPNSSWVLAEMPIADQSTTCNVIRAATGTRSASWGVDWIVAEEVSWLNRNYFWGNL